MAKFKNILECMAETEKMTFLVLFSLFTVFLLWRHYQAEFIYPEKLYTSVYKKGVEACVSEENLSDQACKEYHALYAVEDFRRGFRKGLEGYHISSGDIQVNGVLRNYIKYLRLENYHYERCLKIFGEGTIETERAPEDFCKCKIEKLDEIALELDPLKRYDKETVKVLFQKAYDDARAACRK